MSALRVNVHLNVWCTGDFQALRYKSWSWPNELNGVWPIEVGNPLRSWIRHDLNLVTNWWAESGLIFFEKKKKKLVNEVIPRDEINEILRINKKCLYLEKQRGTFFLQYRTTYNWAWIRIYGETSSNENYNLLKGFLRWAYLQHDSFPLFENGLICLFSNVYCCTKEYTKVTKVYDKCLLVLLFSTVVCSMDITWAVYAHDRSRMRSSPRALCCSDSVDQRLAFSHRASYCSTVQAKILPTCDQIPTKPVRKAQVCNSWPTIMLLLK